MGCGQNRVPCRSGRCPVLRLRLRRGGENQAYSNNREHKRRSQSESSPNDWRIRYGELRHREFRDYPEWRGNNPYRGLRRTE